MNLMQIPFIGTILSIGAIVVAGITLSLSETSSVASIKSLNEVKQKLVTLEEFKSIPLKENIPVLIKGKITSEKKIIDDELGIEAKALKLERFVEMYQWIEDVEYKKIRGSSNDNTKKEEKVYKYKKRWHSFAINSKNFNEQKNMITHPSN